KSAKTLTLLREWQDGRVKLFTTWRMLELRARRAELFRDGAYEPLDAGPHVCAFVRRHDDAAVAVAVPRFVSRLARPGQFPLGEVWGTATLPLPGRWRNVFTGDEVEGQPLALR